MNFACEQCQSRYALPDERLVGKSVRVRCKNCQFMMTVGPLDPLMVPARRVVPATATPSPLASPAKVSASAAPAPVAARWDHEPTRAQPEADPTAQWFAMIHQKQEGPLSPAELAAKVRGGEITPRTYVWKNGMADWKRSADVPEVAVLHSSVQSVPAPRPAPAAKAPPVAPTPSPVRSSGSAAVAARPAVPTPSPVRPTASKPAARMFDEEAERTLIAQAPEEPVRRSKPSSNVLAAAPAPEARPSKPRPSAAAPMPEPAPSPVKAQAKSKVDLSNLFSDPEPELARAAPGKAASRGAAAQAPRAEEEDDPFARVSSNDGLDAPPPGEATSFFIAQAGVHKRNPPWKVAAFAAGGLAIPFVIYLILSGLNVVPAEIHHVDASGKEVASKVLSSDGISALGRMLMGGEKAKPALASRRRAPGVTLPKNGPLPQDGSDGPRGGSAGVAELDTSSVELAKSKAGAPRNRELEKFYGDGQKKDVGPGLNRLAQRDAPAVKDVAGGPPPETISKVVGQNQLAFQFCIEQQLKKNPHFKGGKVSLIATVATSGIVKRTQIDRHDIDASDLGDCLKVKAKRMTFPPFSGDEVDLEIPLILTTAM